MLNHFSFLIAIALIGLLLPSQASAQEAPYAPTVIAPHELLVIDRYETAPIEFPWTRLSSGRVSNRGRMDFEIVFDIDYASARQALEEAYATGESIIALHPDAVRYTEITMLQMAGADFNADESRITVGHREMEPLFQATLQPDGPRTRVIIANSAQTRTFSGFMPARVGFLPMGARPIPFRWN